jgi:CxxC-x17-CxxC domain-containing protein
MEYQDRILTCLGCQQKFVFSKGEQEFYASRGFDKIPTRCEGCREKRRTRKLVALHRLHEVICAKCGCETTVPFEPRENSLVYCRDCFQTGRR